MSQTTALFLEAVDVLLLRGNKLFGDAGSFGGALMPPWPSAAAGALRSRMLADAGANLVAFARGEPLRDEALHAVLGTPRSPGSFRVAYFGLARRSSSGTPQPLFQLPADVVVSKPRNAAEKVVARRMSPCGLPELLRGSYDLPLMPVLEQEAQSKADSGYLLNFDGWKTYLAGGALDLAQHLVHRSQLWQSETRVGVALEESARTVREGALFSTEAVSFRSGVGFWVEVAGASGRLPTHGTLRFGGDGRAVAVSCIQEPYALRSYERPAAGGRFKLVLTTPGIFEGGWRLPGLDDDNIWHGPGDCTAKLVCAAVARAETVSGWDLAQWQPKPAQKAAPTGSVYWFEDFQGDAAALGKLVETGLWGLRGQNDDPQRKAEGFNNVAIGLWQ